MNAGILKTMMPQLLEVAPNAIYVIVTNPCDVLTVLAQEQTGLPPERIFASGTVLDTSRLRWKLGRARRRLDLERARLHRRRARRHRVPAVVEGDDRHRPDPRMGDRGPPAHDADELDAIAIDVRDAAYKVIQGKGATNYAIGLSSARIVEAILGDEHAVMPVSHGAPRLPRGRRRRPLGAVGGQRLRRGADPRGALLAERARAAPAAPPTRCAKWPTRCADPRGWSLSRAPVAEPGEVPGVALDALATKLRDRRLLRSVAKSCVEFSSEDASALGVIVGD